MSEERHLQQMRARFEIALSQWRDNDRQNIYLLHGIGLEEAIQLDGKEDIELQSEDAAELVKTSIYQRDRIQQEEIALQRAYAEEQQKRAEAETSRAQESGERCRNPAQKRRTVSPPCRSALALVVAIASIAAWLATRQSRIATARGLIAEVQLQTIDHDLNLATLLALEAQKRSPDEGQRLLDEYIPSNFRTISHLTVLQEPHGDQILDVSWSPDERLLASASGDGVIKLWDVHKRELIRTLQSNGASVGSVSWSPDGLRLASGSDDGQIKLWDVEQGGMLQVLQGHEDRINSIAWSPNGNMLASGSDDNTVRLWNAEQGQLTQILRGHEARVNSVGWSPDGTTF